MILNDEKIVELFFYVTKLNQHYSNGRYGKMNPLRGQYGCLLLLASKTTVNQKELDDLLFVKPASLSEILTKLEHKAFIVRTSSTTD